MYFGNLASYRLQAKPFGNHPTLYGSLIDYWRLEESGTDPREGVLGRLDLTASISASSTDSGKSNRAFLLDTGNLTVTTSAFNPAPTTSFSFWLYQDDLAFLDDLILNFGIYSIKLDDDGTGIFGVATTESTRIPFSLDTWHHVYVELETVSSSIGTISLIVDNATSGRQTAQYLATPLDPVTFMSIGPTLGNGIRLDELSAWTRALNFSERSALYSAGAGLFY